MKPLGNSLYKRTESKAEVAASIDKELSLIEDSIRKLKIDFDIFFNGNAKRPPLEARGRLEAQIKRISDNRTLTYAQRYRLSALISKFTSYRELWRRLLKAKGQELV